MAELRSVFEAAGARDVQTYIHSGNVVFGATAAVARTLPKRLPAALAAHFGFDIPVIVRTGEAWSRIAAMHPLATDAGDPKHLYVAFLAAEPTAKAVAALDPTRSPGDSFELRGSELYLCLPNGVARTKLTNAYLDRTLGTTATVRNWRTVGALADLAAG
jgi:uncharacterized protein (DUF1697 family)